MESNSELPDVADGAYPVYDDSCLYVERSAYPHEYYEIWEEFSERISHSRRFFSAESEDQIKALLGDLRPETFYLELGPGTELKFLYRGRMVRSHSDIAPILNRQPSSLGPPPPDLAPGEE